MKEVIAKHLKDNDIKFDRIIEYGGVFWISPYNNGIYEIRDGIVVRVEDEIYGPTPKSE